MARKRKDLTVTKVIEEPKRLLCIEEVALRIGLSKRTCYNMMSKGVFPIKIHKFGRKPLVYNRDLERFIENFINSTVKVG